jgi:hypothetical protein
MNRLLIIAPLLVFLLASLPTAVPAAWQGDMNESDDGLRVVNPETPAAGEATLEVRELWRVGHDDELLFGMINELLTDADGNVYLLDGQLQEIQVIDPDGEWLQTIGRQGEGPGEFNNAGDMFWAPTGQIGVIQNWPGKIVMLHPDGRPGDLFELPYGHGGSLQAASRGHGQDGRIVLSGSAWTTENEQQFQRTYLKAYGADGTELASFVEQRQATQFGNFEFTETEFVDFQRRWAAASDGRVAAPLTFDAYRIHVWNTDGSLDRIIERPDYANVERNAAEVDGFQQIYDRITSWNPGSSFQVADMHQAISQMHFRDDGTLWVMSSRDQWRAPDDLFTSFDVYDREGRYVQRVHLDVDGNAVQDGVFFAGDRLYVVTDLMSAFMSLLDADFGGLDEEPQPVSVICYAFQPPAQALTSTGGR